MGNYGYRKETMVLQISTQAMIQRFSLGLAAFVITNEIDQHIALAVTILVPQGIMWLLTPAHHPALTSKILLPTAPTTNPKPAFLAPSPLQNLTSTMASFQEPLNSSFQKRDAVPLP